MSRGRPRKHPALSALDGNPGKRPLPSDLPLNGTPETPKWLKGDAVEHFRFLAAEFGGCGMLKRADGPALAKLADLWRHYLAASAAGDVTDICKLSAAWDRAASKLGILVVDRVKFMATGTPTADPKKEKFLRIAQ